MKNIMLEPMANGLRVMTDKTNIIHKKKMILLGLAVLWHICAEYVILNLKYSS